MAGVTFIETGTGNDESLISEFEAKLGARLPDDYRSWLMVNDGGRPRPSVMAIPSRAKPRWWAVFGRDRPVEAQGVAAMFSLRRQIKMRNLRFWWDTAGMRVIDPGSLPIADNGVGGAFCLSLEKESCGAVFFVESLAAWIMDRKKPRFHDVASSFTEFLNGLRVDER